MSGLTFCNLAQKRRLRRRSICESRNETNWPSGNLPKAPFFLRFGACIEYGQSIV